MKIEEPAFSLPINLTIQADTVEEAKKIIEDQMSDPASSIKK